MNKNTYKKLSKIVCVIIALAVAYVAFIGILIYAFGIDNALTQKTARVIPYPAAIVDGKIIRFSELAKEIASVRMFYENQNFSDIGFRIDFSTSDGQNRLKVKEKDVFNRMIEDAIIEKEVRNRGLEVTSEMADQEVKRKMEEYGSEDYLKENMKRLYGWTVDDFERNIVIPDLYKEKLIQNLKSTDDSYRKAKEKIEQASDELKNRQDFREVAKKYSEGDSAQNEGDLGWFEKDQMLPEISEIAFSLEKGKNSDMIESSIGYHIIRVEDKKTENGIDKVYLRQIFVRTKTMSDWLVEFEKNAKIYILPKEYYWDKNANLVDFSDNNLKDFEKKTFQNN